MKRSLRFFAGLMALLVFSVCTIGVCAAPPRLYRYGDVDNDNMITTTDARLVLQYCAGKFEGKEDSWARSISRLSDVDGDGETTTTDARIILQAAVGMRTYSCVGAWEEYTDVRDEEDNVINFVRKAPKLSWAYGDER